MYTFTIEISVLLFTIKISGHVRISVVALSVSKILQVFK